MIISTQGLVETIVRIESDWRPDSFVLSFWHPQLRSRFSSPLVDAVNLTIAGDSGWKRTAGRVAERLKPIGFVDGELAEMEKAAALVEAAGGHSLIRRARAYGETFAFCTLTVDGVIGESFDLQALALDYHDYLATGTGLAEQIERELARLAPLRFSDFFAFGDVEVSSRNGVRDPGSLARCGLLLGYPVETTAALILSDHRLPSGHTSY